MGPADPPPSEDHLWDYLAVVLRHRKFALAIFLTATSVATIRTLLTRPVYLASSPAAEGLTGQYFANQAAKKSNESSYDPAAAARLWQVSADLVGLNPGAS